MYTSSEGISILEKIKTYKFILGSDNTENNVNTVAGFSKNIAITVSNHDKISLKYGFYYTSSDNLIDVKLSYKWNTKYLPNELIASGENYIITVQINNNSSSDITVSFVIIYGIEPGGDLVLGEN